MIYLTLLAVPFILAYLLLAWFDTHVFIEYAKLVRLDTWIPAIKTYLKMEEEGSPLNFQEYLGQYYHKYFFVRMVLCPICLSPWLTAVLIWPLLFIQWQFFFVLLLPIAYLGLFLYKAQKTLR